MPSQADRALAAAWARRYRDLGFNPLPKRPESNRPWLSRVTKLRDEGVGDSILGRWWADGIQLATGGIWRLLVIDLDGLAAVEVWRDWTLHREMPPTWEVLSGSGSGLHLYYMLPPHVEVRKMVLWQGGKHEAVEALGSGYQIVAPPSIHPRTRRRYRFRPSHSPDDIRLPADVPAWLLSLCLQAAAPEPAPVGQPALPPAPRPIGALRRGKHYQWEDVFPALGDPVSLAKSWGVRLASNQPNPSGWYACHSIYRPDAHPSASLSKRGAYWEPWMGRQPLSIFRLAVELGVYPSFSDAVNDLGDRYL